MDSTPTSPCPLQLVVVVFEVSVNGTTTCVDLPLSRCTRAGIEHIVNAMSSPTAPNTRVFQRYDDSSATYVTLDSEDSFRQLYRAAKATNKVKLRIVELTEPGVANTSHLLREPTQLTHYEDEPEIADELSPEAEALADFNSSTSEEEIRIALAKFRRATVEAIAAMNSSECPDGQLPTIVFPASGPAHLMPCYICKTQLMDRHWHCDICGSGTLNMCGDCGDNGKRCLDKRHILRWREVIDNEIVVRTNKTL